MAQVSGIVIAGANLGKLLASFSLPSFNLATEESDVVGFVGDGRQIGFLDAEDADFDYSRPNPALLEMEGLLDFKPKMMKLKHMTMFPIIPLLLTIQP